MRRSLFSKTQRRNNGDENKNYYFESYLYINLGNEQKRSIENAVTIPVGPIVH